MKSFICMIRGVNVGGRNMLRMDDLKALCSSMGLAGARTYLQSGNVVFLTKRNDETQLAKDIEGGLRKATGIDVRVMLRTAPEMKAAIARNPFPNEVRQDPSHTVIVFLASAPDQEAVATLKKAHAGPEKLHAAGRELYISYMYGEGMARSKLSNALIERKLGVAGTARNWNTVTKLLEMAEEL